MDESLTTMGRKGRIRNHPRLPFVRHPFWPSGIGIRIWSSTSGRTSPSRGYCRGLPRGTISTTMISREVRKEPRRRPGSPGWRQLGLGNGAGFVQACFGLYRRRGETRRTSSVRETLPGAPENSSTSVPSSFSRSAADGARLGPTCITCGGHATTVDTHLPLLPPPRTYVAVQSRLSVSDASCKIVLNDITTRPN